jgi:FMN phosphatase YigB (HAD superfamily)
MKVYCDMDGVLVNFRDPVEAMIKQAIAGEYKGDHPAINKSLVKLREKYNDAESFSFREHNLEPVVKRFMMRVISFDPKKFFFELPPLLDGSVQLWHYINTFAEQVNILTAPVKDAKNSVESARAGKTMWVEKYLNPQPSKIIIADAVDKRKWALSENGKPNILIDDKKSTIDSWNEDGGIGILHIPGESSHSIKILSKYF